MAAGSVDSIVPEPNTAIRLSPPSGIYPHPFYRPDIDGLRAIAVLSVVGFHAFPGWVGSGFVGVDFFFVISGYLITGIILQGLSDSRFSFVEFYSRRIKRIFSALALVLVATLGFGYVLLLPEEFKLLGKHIAGAGGFAANIVLWSEAGYFDPAGELKPLLHLWSLGVEEQFYVLWPLLLLLMFHFRSKFLAGITVVLGISFLANVGRIGEHPVEVFFLPMARFWELAAGGYLAYRSIAQDRNGSDERGNDLLAIAGLMLAAVSIFVLGKERPFPGWSALLPVLAASFIIAAGPAAWINRRVLSNAALVFVGLISYPVYLWHWPILSFARIALGGTPPLSIRIAAVVISLFLGWLTYRWIERPIRAAKSLKVPGALLVIIACLVVAGLFIFVKQGLPERFPPIVRKLEAYKLEGIADVWREHRCFLEPGDIGTFAAECIDPPTRPGPLVFLWGDSHGAAAYPGLRALQDHWVFRLAQFTISTCPPFVDFSSPENIHCTAANANALAAVVRARPDVVILHANWIHPRFSVLKDEDEVGLHLKATVERLRRVGVRRIILLGLVPQWVDGLPRTLFRYYKTDPLHRLPERIPYTNDSVPHADRRLREIAAQLGVDYVSALDILCQSDAGCIAVLGEEDRGLSAYDYGHLTPAGSKFLAAGMQPLLQSVAAGARQPAKTSNSIEIMKSESRSR
jgi:peptidoglycan/LPS O-acetylase OafA/YrhL/lysophospholipase L1-like esterase